jgi:Tfp pilus assembly protein PilO
MADGFNFNEWLAKAKEDPKVAAQPLIVIIGIIVAGWKFLYSPQQIILQKELKKNKGVEAQIKGLESAVANIEEIKIEVNDLRKSWSEVETLCYKKNEASMFIQDLRNIGRQANINLRSISPQPAIQKTFETLNYEIYPVRISFAGEYKQLGLFLRCLEKHPKIIFLDLPNLETDASGTFRFDLIPKTILLAEQAQAAAPPPEE